MKSEERRAAIVAQAVRLFAEKGFRGTTTRELAAACGVSEPVLYQHFRTKGELYRAIIETKAREGAEKAGELCRHLAGDDDRRFLSALAELILGRYREDPDFMRLLLFSALENHELAALFFEGQVAQFYNLVAGYIRRRIRAGAFRRVNPKFAARSFIGMVSHPALMQLLFQDRVVQNRPNKVIDALVTLFLNGITAQRGCN